jgi:membrane protease subunit HflK
VLVLLNAMRLLWFERWQTSYFGRAESALAGGVSRVLPLGPAVAAGRWAWKARGGLLRLAVWLVAAAYLSRILVFVEPDEVAVVQRFGRFHAVLSPGPHLRLPPPWDTITREKPNLVRTIEIGARRTPPDELQAAAIEWNTPHAQGDESLLLTGDQSLVELAATIQYRISDIRAYRFGAADPEKLLASVAEGVIREAIASRPLLADSEGADGEAANELLTRGRGPLEELLRTEIQQRADALRLGVEVAPGGVCLQDVHPPQEVVGAFRDVSTAFKEMERMRNEADAYHREVLIHAAGEAAWQALAASHAEVDPTTWAAVRRELAGEASAEIHSAQAFAVERQALSEGDAARFLARQAAQSEAPGLTRWRLYLDAVGQTLPGKQKLILDPQGSGRRHLLLGLPESPPPAIPLLQPGLEEEE